MQAFLKRLLLFLIIPFAGFLLSAADYSWRPEERLSGPQFTLGSHLRIGVPDPDFYDAPPEVKSVQQHQVEHSRLGFLWRPLIDEKDNVVIKWGDIPAGALTTGRYGFSNSAGAIEDLEAGERVNVVGVGASFMGGAHDLFYEYFWLRDLFYYNMSHGRYTLPQYNIAMEDYALPLEPDWIIYGMNESSHLLIKDFESWRRSGRDWFDYHCGYWAGPARKSGFPHDILRKWPPLFAYYNAVQEKLWPQRPAATVMGKKRQVSQSLEYIRRAGRMAREKNVNFVVMLIPSKARMLKGASNEHYLLEHLVPLLNKEGIPYIDLRTAFGEVEDPASLYFHYDAHWNRQGVYIAAREFLKYMDKKDQRHDGNS